MGNALVLHMPQILEVLKRITEFMILGRNFFNGNIGNATIENNEFYPNGDSGKDLRHKANDFRIINNNFRDNGRQGITCSAECENVLIESNNVLNCLLMIS